MKSIALLIFWLIFGATEAQHSLRIIESMEFQKADGSPIPNPFTGGLTIPHFNQMDVNRDGQLDLIVTHITGFQNTSHLIFLNKNGQFIHSLAYDRTFSNFTSRFVLRDFNCDNIPDLITIDQGEYKIYTASLPTSDTIYKFTFEKAVEAIDSMDMGVFNLANSTTEVPIIEDVDGDGDIDLMHFYTGEGMRWIKNMQAERGKKCTNQFEFVGIRYWGDFLTDVGLNCGTVPTTIKPRHCPGQNTWALDANDDGLLDICASDEMYRNTTLGLNIGTQNLPRIRQSDTFFPNYDPISFLWSRGYWLDINQDGKKDILASFVNHWENTSIVDSLVNEDVHVAMYYQATKRGNKYDSFALKGDLSLTHSHIDVGSFSRPIFYDYNLDGKWDILIPTRYRITRTSKNASISLYKNIGTNRFPKYKLITDDFFGFKNKNVENITLARGDINSDGRQDLLVHYTHKNINKFDRPSKVFWYLKPADSNILFNNQDTQHLNLLDIHPLGYLFNNNPIEFLIVDLDSNQTLDLIMTHYQGVSAHLNSGTTSAPIFNTSGYRNWFNRSDNNDLSSCFGLYKDSTGIEHLLQSKRSSSTYYYSFVKHNRYIFAPSDSFIQPINLNFFNNQLILNNMSFDMADINQDGHPEMLVGSEQGGIKLFTTNPKMGVDFIAPPDNSNLILSEENNLGINWKVFPNPAKNYFIIEMDEKQTTRLQIFDLMGREIYNEILNANSHEINIENWPSGTYILILNTNSQSTIQKLIIQK